MMKVELLDYTKLSNAVIGARTCHQSFYVGHTYNNPTDDITNEDKKLLSELLYKYHHDSIARHVKYTFMVHGISTKTLLGLSRHQVGVDLSVMSSRHCKLDKFGTEFTRTPNDSVNKLLEKHIKDIVELSASETIKAEDLAYLYPQAMQYDLVISMNVQSLKHFFDLRDSDKVNFDIRVLAIKLREALPLKHRFLYYED